MTPEIPGRAEREALERVEGALRTVRAAVEELRCARFRAKLEALTPGPDAAYLVRQLFGVLSDADHEVSRLRDDLLRAGWRAN